jgi:hypothetical protein
MAVEKVQEEVKVKGCVGEKVQCKVDDMQDAGGEAENLGEDRAAGVNHDRTLAVLPRAAEEARRLRMRMSSCLKTRTL